MTVGPGGADAADRSEAEQHGRRAPAAGTRVEAVELRDFRNYDRGATELGQGLTIVSGSNGAGKTNLLEAIYFGLTARSCRTSNEREMVRRGGGPARVVVATVAADGRHRLEVALEPGGPKRARLDGSPVEGPPAVSARPPVVVFIPERLDLVKGPPAHRRAHLDRFVSAVWPARTSTRAAYARALGQRNALLGRIRAGRARADQLEAWDAQLARCGSALMGDRAEAADRLAGPFTERAAELGLPLAQVSYRPRAGSADVAGLERELAEHRRQDLDRGFTTHGPHRDELALLHGRTALKAFGSQGQQRLAVLALLLAERDVLAARGRPPLMLLDDVMSELDGDRRVRLVEALAGVGQAVVTATDREHVPAPREPAAAHVSVVEGRATAAPRAVAA